MKKVLLFFMFYIGCHLLMAQPSSEEAEKYFIQFFDKPVKTDKPTLDDFKKIFTSDKYESYFRKYNEMMEKYKKMMDEYGETSELGWSYANDDAENLVRVLRYTYDDIVNATEYVPISSDIKVEDPEDYDEDMEYTDEEMEELENQWAKEDILNEEDVDDLMELKSRIGDYRKDVIFYSVHFLKYFGSSESKYLFPVGYINGRWIDIPVMP